MSAPNAIAADRLVHVIVEQGNRRTYFHHTDRLQNEKTKQWFTVPVVDDDPAGSHSMPYSMALICKNRWETELGLTVRIALETSGPYIDQAGELRLFPWEHQNYLVTVNEDGCPIDDLDSPFTYEVAAVCTPNGKQFCWKSDHALLVNQAQFSSFEEGPETCVLRAFEKGYTKIDPPKANPHLEARREEAARNAAARRNTISNLRPADRG